MTPLISVCIPAYNRVAVLPELLESVLSQRFHAFEIVICEDASPEREAIRAVVERYARRNPGLIRYEENGETLGFDGNIRRLVEVAEGEYCLFLGNDDLLCENALERVAEAIRGHDNVGVVLRSYAAFLGPRENVTQVFRYFDSERFFPAGPESVVTFYRRSVVLPGLVLHRESALRYASDLYDGTLLYQVYLVSNIVLDKNGVFVPELIALYRMGGTPDFGRARSEQGRFVPTEQTPESSALFVEGMLRIARGVGESRQQNIYSGIERDIWAYSYPILAIQARRPLQVFLRYVVRLARLGAWRSGWFYSYLVALLLLGPGPVDKCIAWVKRRVGHTPSLRGVYGGKRP